MIFLLTSTHRRQEGLGIPIKPFPWRDLASYRQGSLRACSALYPMASHASLKARCSLRAAAGAPHLALARPIIPTPFRKFQQSQDPCQIARLTISQRHERSLNIAAASSNGASAASGLKIDLQGEHKCDFTLMWLPLYVVKLVTCRTNHQS